MTAKRRLSRAARQRRKMLIGAAAISLIAGATGFCIGRHTGSSPGTVPYRESLARWCGEYGVNPALAAAVLEAESSGRPRAVSSSGALGLMQLMPRTAAMIASELGLPPPEREDLFNPDTNIRFGVYYLSKLGTRFDNEREFVIAGYHAGPTRVDIWRTSRSDLSAGEVIEQLAYPETRKYVNRVLSLWERNAKRGR